MCMARQAPPRHTSSRAHPALPVEDARLVLLEAHRAAHLGVCTAAIACLLASAGVACVWNGLAAFLASSFAAEAAMGPWPFVVALFACAGKEALYRVTAAVGVKRRSAILIASAKHHRSDAITSVAAALGSGGVLLGFPAADALAAAVVGAIIIKMSVEIGFGVAH